MADMTVADVRKMLRGEPLAQATGNESMPAVPPDAVGSVTIETVKEQPLQTVETAEIVESRNVPVGKGKRP